MDDSNLHQPPKNSPPCLSLRLEIDPQVQAGERVTLTLKAKNACDSPAEVFLGGRPAHDFIVTRPDGKQIWRWLQGKTIQAILGYRVLRPGQELEFTGEWDQRDSEGKPVPAGTYRVTAILKGNPPEVLKTGPQLLTIVP